MSSSPPVAISQVQDPQTMLSLLNRAGRGTARGFTLVHRDLSEDGKDAALNVLITEVPSSMQHARSIELCLASRETFQEFLNDMVEEAPTLEYLGLTFMSLDDALVEIPQNFLRSTAPNLSYIRLQNCSVPWASPIFQNLSSLDIELPDPPVDDYYNTSVLKDLPSIPTLAELFNVLRSSSSIQRLRLFYALPFKSPAEWAEAATADRLTLLKLESLELAGRPCDCLGLIGCLRIPHTTSLHINVSYSSASDCQRNIGAVIDAAANHCDSKRGSKTQPLDRASIEMWEEEELVMSVTRAGTSNYASKVTIHHVDLAERPHMDLVAMFMHAIVSLRNSRTLAAMTVVDHRQTHLSPKNFGVMLAREPQLTQLTLCLCSVPAFARFFSQLEAPPTHRTCLLPNLRKLTIRTPKGRGSVDSACSKPECQALELNLKVDEYVVSAINAWDRSTLRLREVELVGWLEAEEGLGDTHRRIKAGLETVGVETTFAQGSLV